MHGAYAVGFFKSVLIPSLDNARIAVTFGYAVHVDLVARNERVSLDFRAYRVSGNVFKTEFLKNLAGLNARFLELSAVNTWVIPALRPMIALFIDKVLLKIFIFRYRARPSRRFRRLPCVEYLY